MATYKSAYSGPQIDEAIGKALNPDAAPTNSSTNLVESGGVATALAGKASVISGVTSGSAITISNLSRLNLVLATRGDTSATFMLVYHYSGWATSGTNQAGLTLDTSTGELTIPSYTHYKIIT